MHTIKSGRLILGKLEDADTDIVELTTNTRKFQVSVSIEKEASTTSRQNDLHQMCLSPFNESNLVMGQTASRPVRDGNQVAADALETFRSGLSVKDVKTVSSEAVRPSPSGTPTSRTSLVVRQTSGMSRYGSVAKPMPEAQKGPKRRTATLENECSGNQCACQWSAMQSAINESVLCAGFCPECESLRADTWHTLCQDCQMPVARPLVVVDALDGGRPTASTRSTGTQHGSPSFHSESQSRPAEPPIGSSRRPPPLSHQRGRRHLMRLMNKASCCEPEYESEPKGASPADVSRPLRHSASEPPSACGGVSCASSLSLLSANSMSTTSTASLLFAVGRRKSPQSTSRHTNTIGHNPHGSDLATGRSSSARSRDAATTTTSATSSSTSTSTLDSPPKASRQLVEGSSALNQLVAGAKPTVLTSKLSSLEGIKRLAPDRTGAPQSAPKNKSTNLHTPVTCSTTTTTATSTKLNTVDEEGTLAYDSRTNGSRRATLSIPENGFKTQEHKKRELTAAPAAAAVSQREPYKSEHFVWNELAIRYGRMQKSTGRASVTSSGGQGGGPTCFEEDEDYGDGQSASHLASRRRPPSRSSCLLHLLLATLQTLFPLLGSLKHYKLPSDLMSDLAAGFTVAVLHIPQGMAYGLLSGVEPIYGLYVSFVPVLVMSLMSKSRHVSYGTFAVISMLLVNTIDNVRQNLAHELVLNSTSTSVSASVGARTFLPLVITDNHRPLDERVVRDRRTSLKSSTNEIDPMPTDELLTSRENLPSTGETTGAQEVNMISASSAFDIPAVLPTNIEILSCVCILCGLIHITMSLARLGILSLMFSDQLVSSFTTASAIHVLTSQLAGLFDLSLPLDQDEFLKIVRTWWNFGRALLVDFNQTTALLSLVSIAFLLFVKELVEPALRRRFARLTCLPSELVLMAIVILGSWHFKLQEEYGVKIIGHVPTGLPEARSPRLDLVPYVIKDALTIALISFAMNLSIAQVYAKKFRYTLDANQELFALGSANIVGSFFNCFPCASSLSRSSVQSNLNVRSQLCSLFSCAIVVLIICFFAHILHDLPRSTLSCIIVVALKGIIMQFRDLYDNWRLSKLDALVWVLTFVSVIVFGVTFGLILGIIASLFMIFIRLLSPNHSILGQLPGTEIYMDTNAFIECKEIDNIKIFRFNSALCYLNRTMLKSKIEKLLPAVYKPQGFSAICAQFHQNSHHQNSKIHFLIIDCSALSYCDYSGAATLVELIEDLEREKVSVYLAACPLKLVDMFEKMKPSNNILGENVYPTIGDAIARSRHLLATRFSSCDNRKSIQSVAKCDNLERLSRTISTSRDSKDKSEEKYQSILDVP